MVGRPTYVSTSTLDPAIALLKRPSCKRPNLFLPIPPLRTNISSKISRRLMRCTNSSILADILSRSYSWQLGSLLQTSFPCTLSIRSARSIQSSRQLASSCWFSKCRISLDREEKRETIQETKCLTSLKVTCKDYTTSTKAKQGSDEEH